MLSLFGKKQNIADIERGSQVQTDLAVLFSVIRSFTAVSVDICIRRGNVMLGILGEEERMEGTAIPGAVNAALRLEGRTEIYGPDVLVAQQVMKTLNGHIRYGFSIMHR